MPYVNRIELRGFKSFGVTKISLPLSRGLTAVVGRNGSGKSNIADAFCFVFGGRSGKTMRTERFSDFIYARNKRPVAPFAEVTLCIDNRDGGLAHDSSMLVISRRVDRDGKCVCKINGKRVVRQEIVDLLSPTMGTPDGYNFVMQGEVKKIVEKSPLELRQILDELAGVAEYEKRKEDTNRKLQETDGNLRLLEERLGGIFREVEKLKGQVRDAQRYRYLKTELERVKGALLNKKILGQEKKRKDLERLVKSLDVKYKEQQGKYKEFSKRADAYEEEVFKLQRLIDRERGSEVMIRAGALRDRLSTLADMLRSTAEGRERILEEMENAKKSLGGGKVSKVLAEMERFKHLQERFERLGEELGRAKSLEEARETIERIGGVLREITATIHGLFAFFSKRKVSEAEAVYFHESTRLEGRLQAYEEQAEELRQKIADTKEQLKRMSSQEAKLRSTIVSLERRRDKLSEKAKRSRTKAGECQQRLIGLNSQIGSKRTEKIAVGEELKSLREELANVRTDFTAFLHLDEETLNHKILSIQGELDALGDVNQRAPRDLRDAEARYETEKRKHDKLVADRQALLDYMREIDEKKKEVFMRVFAEISRHFQEVFRELSGTGVGNLRLESEENPFEGGLELEADFGEGLNRLRSLSGGQKTLTALAFLFALQLYRPTTFYVMDEIDESLDPQNRERVAKLLHKFSKDSQMIVVTLYDTIAAAADRVFGVIKENGVSRILSVELAGLGD